MRNFYVRKLRAQLFCAYILGLYFTGVSLPVQKLHVEKRWNLTQVTISPTLYEQLLHRKIDVDTVCARNCGHYTQTFWTTNFFSSFSICLNHFSWEFIKNLRSETICRREFLFFSVRFSLCRRAFVFPGVHFLLHKGHNSWHTLYYWHKV